MKKSKCHVEKGISEVKRVMKTTLPTKVKLLNKNDSRELGAFKPGGVKICAK